MGSLPLGMEPFMWTCPLPFGREQFPFRKAEPLVFGSEVVSVGSKTEKKTYRSTIFVKLSALPIKPSSTLGPNQGETS